MSFLSLDEQAQDLTGYWSPITATLYWCENKYQFSHYIAEFTNTISNVFFIGLSLYGMYRVGTENLPARFVLCYGGIALVGIGSLLFHMTLKYNAQMLDELPMLYTSTLLTYSVCETSKGYDPKKRRFRYLLPSTLIIGVTAVSLIYAYNRNPVFHQVAYAIIQGISTLRVGILIYSSKSPLAAESAREARQQIRYTYNLGSAIFVTGFLIWNLDNIFCSSLRETRFKIGWPVAFLLEGHAWWHLMTGSGAYLLVVASELLVISLKESPENVVLAGTFLPYVLRVKDYVEEPSKEKVSGGKVLRNGKKVD